MTYATWTIRKLGLFFFLYLRKQLTVSRISKGASFNFPEFLQFMFYHMSLNSSQKKHDSRLSHKILDWNINNVFIVFYPCRYFFLEMILVVPKHILHVAAGRWHLNSVDRLALTKQIDCCFHMSIHHLHITNRKLNLHH